MGDDIGLGLSSMAVCFDFRSTNIVQLSKWSPYFFRFWCHHPLITQLTCESVETFWFKCDFPKYLAPLLFDLCPSIPKSIYKKNLPYLPFPAAPINCYVLIHSYTTHSTKAILTYLIYMNLAALTPILQGDIT